MPPPRSALAARLAARQKKREENATPTLESNAESTDSAQSISTIPSAPTQSVSARAVAAAKRMAAPIDKDDSPSPAESPSLSQPSSPSSESTTPAKKNKHTKKRKATAMENDKNKTRTDTIAFVDSESVEESDDDDDAAHIENESSTSEAVPDLIIDPESTSCFTPSESNVQSAVPGCILIGLMRDESIVFAGQALIAPLHGSVSIAGATLVAPETEDVYFYPVFSPKTHSLLSVQSSWVTETRTKHHGTIELDNDSSKIWTISREMQKNGNFDSILAVRELDWCGLNNIGFSSRYTNVLKPSAVDQRDDALHSVAEFYPILSPVPGLLKLKISENWRQNVDAAIRDAQQQHRNITALVCGSKDMGKSTFTRYLTNRLLNVYKRVAYLETDIGQTEFTPSGLISLHVIDSPILGPPYTHQHMRPKRSYFFGSLTARDDPSYYVMCISQLIRLYQEEYDRDEEDLVPLVVNTHGWIHGLGYDLLLNIIRDAAPTDIFALEDPDAPPRNLPMSFLMDIQQQSDENGMRAPTTVRSLQCHRAAGDTTIMSRYVAKDMRLLAFTSYMHQNTKSFGQLHSAWWSFNVPLVNRRPWALDWQQGLPKGIWILHNHVAFEHILYALNGSIVGLLGEIPNSDQQQEEKTLDEQEKSQKNAMGLPRYYSSAYNRPPSPILTECYGLGVIRAIDPVKRQFLILTPLPLDVLVKVTAIALGTMQLPAEIMVDGRTGGVAGIPWDRVPYMTMSVRPTGPGGAEMKIRRNKKRRAYGP